jgi:hypothetical protein
MKPLKFDKLLLALVLSLFVGGIFASHQSVQASQITNPSFFNGKGATYIDFEGLYGILNTQYSGVEFSSEDYPDTLQTTDPGDTSGRFTLSARVSSAIDGLGVPTHGERYALGYWYTGRTGNGFNVSDIRIDFLPALSAFGFYLIDNDFSDVRVTAYDGSGGFLESVIVPKVTEGGATYVGISYPGISYIIIDGKDGLPIDSLAFDELSSTQVPLPSGLFLLGVGIFRLVSYGRRK